MIKKANAYAIPISLCNPCLSIQFLSVHVIPISPYTIPIPLYKFYLSIQVSLYIHYLSLYAIPISIQHITSVCSTLLSMYTPPISLCFYKIPLSIYNTYLSRQYLSLHTIYIYLYNTNPSIQYLSLYNTLPLYSGIQSLCIHHLSLYAIHIFL